MTTISNNTLTDLQKIMASSRKVANGINVTNTLKVSQPSAEEKARVAKLKADAAALQAASQKQRLEIEKITHPENHDIFFSGTEDPTPENVKKALTKVQVIIESRENVGMNFHARFGDRLASDINTYMSWLKESISMSGSAKGTPPNAGGKK